jgi:TolB-like protein/tetratricopeptide (TPR) repeat protein
LLYLFEDYALDTDRRELRRGGVLLSVEPKVFDLLVHLISNRERVVSKDDLIGAVWNGRIVSESTLTSCINAARSAIGDSGDAQRLIKTLPRKGVRFVATVQEEKSPADLTPPYNPTEAPRPALTLPDKPSVAVLPFTNMSSDPEQDYFADGIVEEIVTALSQMRWLFVIARNSTATYKGRDVDVKQVGRELGVRYVLEGSVRKSGKRLRITGQLIDASTGIHLWADRYEGAPEDVFDLQDRVTESVVGAIGPKVEQTEIERAKRKPTASLDAYDYYLRGIANYYPATREEADEMLRHLRSAIDRDPDFAAAYGMAAWCFARRKGSGWTIDSDGAREETARLARLAVALAKDDALAIAWAAFALALVVGELDEATGLIDRALELNPNLAIGWGSSGWIRVWRGDLDVALEHLARARRLSPFGPMMGESLSATAHAHFFAGRYEEACHWAARTRLESPHVLGGVRIAAASNALAGRPDQAQAAVADLLRIDPVRRISNWWDTLGPYRHPDHRAMFLTALRRAGLPEN